MMDVIAGVSTSSGNSHVDVRVVMGVSIDGQISHVDTHGIITGVNSSVDYC